MEEVLILDRTKLSAYLVRTCDLLENNCDRCRKPITEKIKIRELKQRNIFHLQCFIPSLNQAINLRDIKCWKEKHKHVEITKEIKDWAKNWNSHFIPLEYSSTTPQHFRKRLNDFSYKNRRAWLEVFKFLSPFNWVKIAPTCKEFYQLSWEKELWQFTSGCNSPKNVIDLRLLYISQYICYDCGKYMKDTKFWCPLLQKHICKECRYYNMKFKLYSKDELNQKFDVNPNTLNLVYGSCKIQKYVYHFILEKELKFTRIKNKEIIIKNFRNNYTDRKDVEVMLGYINNEDGTTPNNAKELLAKNKFIQHFDDIKRLINLNRFTARLIRWLNFDIKLILRKDHY